MTKDFSKDWWRGGVIYQIYPRSFMDASGDGIGDLAGITQKLDYVKSLGVDAIWISPFFKSPMKDFGYDVSDYMDVDPLFGTLDDYDELQKKADSLDLPIMVDQVLSHSSDEHPWFKESRSSRNNSKHDWYIWADPKPDGTPPNNWMSIFGGSGWTWDTKRRQYYMHNFLESQPDVNFHNPEARKALLETVEFWLKRGVKGFRFDAVNFYFHHTSLKDNPVLTGDPLDYVPESNPYGMQEHLYDKTQPENLAFLEELRQLLDHYEGTTSVGEMGARDSLRLMSDYTEYEKRLHMVYTFHLLGDKKSPEYIRETVEYLESHIRDGWPCWALSNHDVPRAVTRWREGATPEHDTGDDHYARMLLALLTSLRGSYCLYQGEELALPEADIPFEQIQDPYGKRFWPEFKGRDGCRTPMPWKKGAPHGGFSTAEPWLPVPGAHVARAVDAQEHIPGSALNHTRHFLNWRKSQPALRYGSISFVDAPDGVLGFERQWRDDRLVVLCNTSAQEVAVSLKDWSGVNELHGHGLQSNLGTNEVVLPPYGVFYGKVES